MSTNKVCVVIPIHNSIPSVYEIISFRQCFKILGNHPIYVVAPFGLNIDAYNRVVENFNVKFINPRWQKNLLNYNKLKLSRFFYSLFKDYEYMLTYELDAFVFSDALLDWCNKEYDFIGAPWFDGYITDSKKIIGVGNSGFSLRKIKSIKKGISKVYYKDPKQFESGRKKKVIAFIAFPYYWFSTLLFENLFIQSFEVNPSFLYKINNNKLPMGCHAWWRYDLEFWKPFIEEYGYKV
jgi:hypothetical protein